MNETANNRARVPASAPQRALLAVLAAYRRWVSPLLPPACRFHPSCSDYAAQAIHTHGAARGGGLALRRVCRCHPFSAGGFDPVPPKRRAAALRSRLSMKEVR